MRTINRSKTCHNFTFRHDLMNVRLQGPDYVPLEKFQSYVDRMARKFGFKVIDRFSLFNCSQQLQFSYAVAAQTQKAVTYKPNNTITESEMDLHLYDRCSFLSLGIYFIQSSTDFCRTCTSFAVVYFTSSDPCPSRSNGLLHFFSCNCLQITIKDHEKADEDYRYIPDVLLKQKQEELKALDDPNVRRNLGWE